MYRQTNALYEFDHFRFDASRRVLWRNEVMVSLTPKAGEVLAVLISQRGNLVERQELLQAVWSDSFVEDGNLNHAISVLRRTLGNDVIQTIPRRGYRFAADVRPLDAPSSDTLIERHVVTNTVIEEKESLVTEQSMEAGADSTLSVRGFGPASFITRRFVLLFATAAILVCVSGAVWYVAGLRNSSKAARRPVRTLAVLPLRSFAKDGSDEALRLRLTDSLITRLGMFENIIVRSTSSVLPYIDRPEDSLDAGVELNVDAVLDGRVQEENGRLRVTLQMISVPDGEQLWSEQFDGQAGATLALQDLIAARFVKDFGYTRSESSIQRPINSEAYEAYLKGRYLWNQRRRDTYYKALEYFQKSVEIDPGFALGYSGIADCYHLMEQRNDIPTREAMDKAESAVRRALELDPDLAEANTSMGSIMFIKYSRWGEAEKYYRRAIALNPNLAEPYARLGMLYNAWGRFDDGYAVLTRANELEPTSLNNAIYLGMNFCFSKQYDRAEAQFKRILQFAPNTERAHWFLERIYELTGRYDEAVVHGLKERELTRPETVDPLLRAYRAGGVKSFWLKQIELLKEESKSMYGLDYRIASRYALAGDAEKACDHVEKNLIDLGSMRNYGRTDPLFDPLRSKARFIKLMHDTAPIL